MEYLAGAAATVIVSVIGGFFTWLTTRSSQKSQREVAETSSRADEWQKMFDTFERWTMRQLEERDKKIAVLEAGQEQDRSEIRSQRREIKDLRAKYHASLEAIRRWIKTPSGAAMRQDLPEEIQADLENL